MTSTSKQGRKRDCFGLTLAERRRAEAALAQRDERVRRERLMVAAASAMQRGTAPAMDSKGWPLGEDGWPLSPLPTAALATKLAYHAAVSRAKVRTARQANAARRAEAFDITKLDLSGVSAHGSPEAPTQREERRKATLQETVKLW